MPSDTQVTARVARAARLLFDAEAQRAIACLLRYGEGAGAERVHLAVLKLSDGDLAALERQVEVALVDHRDVLAPAEYPRQDAMGPPRGALARMRMRWAGRLDARDHAAWLARFASEE